MPDINKISQKIIDILKGELVILWFFALAASFALIILQNKSKLPLGKGDFVFLAILALLVALYKPRWIFFLFVSFVPLENIILASGFFPVQLRPYQFLGAILALALVVLFVFRRFGPGLRKPVWIDWAVFALVPFSFLALLGAPNVNVGLKNNLVLFSFVILYYLIRNFIKTREDLTKTVFFFIGSFLAVAAYGFYQIFSDKFGAKSFEVMFGRPNSTFTEPDWLGIYLCFALAAILSAIYYCHPALDAGSRKPDWIPAFAGMTKESSHKLIKPILYFLIFLNLTLLILTLSRSAWIGATVVAIFFLLALIPTHKPTIVDLHVKEWKDFFKETAIIFFIIIISLFAVHFGKLSKFNVFDRARSAATSEQKITIACNDKKNIPQTVADVGELAEYDCRHINLEDIDSYESQGKFVTEIFRQDPNIATRSEIYRKSWREIKKHPILGIGFGSITQTLGADERGAGLNESNIFLQVWAGSGILGLIAFISAIGYLFIYAFRRVSPVCPMNKIIGCPVVKDNFEKTLNVFAVLSILAIIIPNLFNAGLFMGAFWLGLAAIASAPDLSR